MLPLSTTVSKPDGLLKRSEKSSFSFGRQAEQSRPAPDPNGSQLAAQQHNLSWRRTNLDEEFNTIYLARTRSFQIPGYTGYMPGAKNTTGVRFGQLTYGPWTTATQKLTAMSQRTQTLLAAEQSAKVAADAHRQRRYELVTPETPSGYTGFLPHVRDGVGNHYHALLEKSIECQHEQNSQNRQFRETIRHLLDHNSLARTPAERTQWAETPLVGRIPPKPDDANHKNNEIDSKDVYAFGVTSLPQRHVHKWQMQGCTKFVPFAAHNRGINEQRTREGFDTQSRHVQTLRALQEAQTARRPLNSEDLQKFELYGKQAYRVYNDNEHARINGEIESVTDDVVNCDIVTKVLPPPGYTGYYSLAKRQIQFRHPNSNDTRITFVGYRQEIYDHETTNNEYGILKTPLERLVHLQSHRSEQKKRLESVINALYHAQNNPRVEQVSDNHSND